MSEIDWADFGAYDVPLPTHWKIALQESENSYSWSDFNAFYDPNARRYFWRGASGCSCDSWGTYVEGVASFEDGNRKACGDALRRFAKDQYWSASRYIDALERLNNFKEDA